MFSKKSLHVTLAFVLLIGLAAMGLAYGAWTDQLIINGAITTGEFDIAVTGSVIGDSDGAAPNGGDCTFVQDTVNPNKWVFSLTNGYPGFHCTISTTMTNVGGFDATYTYSWSQYPNFGGQPMTFDFSPKALPPQPLGIGYADTQEITFTVNDDPDTAMNVTQSAELTFDFTQVIPALVAE